MQKTSAYKSYQVKTANEIIKTENFENSIKALEYKNKMLAEANQRKDEQIRALALQNEHSHFLLNDYQYQIAECR